MPVASFNFAAGGNGLAYTFSDMTTGGATAWMWSFGDGGTAVVANPSHTYAADGAYTVVLIAMNSCGADTFSQTINAVGIEGSLAGSEITILPNPARGSFLVEVKGLEAGALDIEVLDLQGKLQATFHLEDAANFARQRVDASRLAKGTYFIRLRQEFLTEMRKVVVE
jgi:PKD repeat protein